VPALNPSYVGPREDILAMLPDRLSRFLDVGCSVGTLGEAVKQQRGAWVTGIEMDEPMARLARERIDRVIVSDVEGLDLAACAIDGAFDCICFADVLEHLCDPWKALQRMTEKLLAPGGSVVASIPNIRHHSTIANLIFRGYWPYRDRGIHDRTHMRFFTLRNIVELFESAGLRVEKVSRNYRLIERPSRINRIAPAFALPGLREFLAFQYLIRARRN